MTCSFYEGVLWKVTTIEGRGQGVIAKEDLEPGTLILADDPLFIGPDNVHTKDPTHLDNYLTACVSELSEEKQQIFVSLAD
jgi:hypothetical protein